jgi:hypothetical protein
MSPGQGDHVIAAEDIANLGPDNHLIIDLRFESYRIDASVFSADLRYVDIVDPVGRLLVMEQLISQIVTTNVATREDLMRGFSMRAIGDQLEVNEFPTRTTGTHNVTAQANILGAFDIGVIPATRSCPSGSEAIVINMDDEDSGNANSRGGWIGAIISNSNTSFFFCRVDGQSFRPLTTQFTATQDHYAVLKLGTACPNNSLDFARGFDNEDSGNSNSFSGNIAPNISNSNTTLRFCLFRSDAVTMGGFPFLGFSYGVFASSIFSRQLASGFVRTDDEDGGNSNSYSANSAWITDAQRIVTAGGNTTLNLAQVR